MGMAAEIQNPAVVGQGPPQRVGTNNLDSAAIIRALHEHDAGFHADFCGNKGIWHPYIDTRQGLFYLHKHICSMDRGAVPQWPKWSVALDLVEVPLDYALKHEDLPIVTIDPLKGDPRFPNVEDYLDGGMATVERPCLDDVEQVGWAEVFYRLIKSKHGGLSAGWFARTFRVPMDWYGQMNESPLSHSFRTAANKGWVAGR